MSAISQQLPDADAVLAKALLNTREQLGLTQQAMADEAAMSEFFFILCLVKYLSEGLSIVVIADQQLDRPIQSLKSSLECLIRGLIAKLRQIPSDHHQV